MEQMRKNQQQGGSDDDYAMAMQENQYLPHVGVGKAVGLSEADGVILMELLEDSPPADQLLDDDVDRLTHVIQSLEAEIGAGGAEAQAMESTGPSSEDGDPALEDMLLMDLDAGYADGYWPPVGQQLGGGWYVYTETAASEGGVLGYEVRDHHYFYAAADQGSVEPVYSPLWE